MSFRDSADRHRIEEFLNQLGKRFRGAGQVISLAGQRWFMKDSQNRYWTLSKLLICILQTTLILSRSARTQGGVTCECRGSVTRSLYLTAVRLRDALPAPGPVWQT